MSPIFLTIIVLFGVSNALQDYNDAVPLRNGSLSEVRTKESESTSSNFEAMELRILLALKELNKKYDGLTETISHKLANKMQNTEENTSTAEDICETRNYLGCKEKIVEGSYKFTPYYRLDELVHTTLWYKEDEDGGGVSFKMHLAIRTPMKGFIRLSSVPKVGNNDTVFEIGVGENNNKTYLNSVQRDTELHINNVNYTEIKDTLKNFNTPNVLSSDRYTNFYIQLDNGTISFGKEEIIRITNRVESKTITNFITYSDPRFKTLQYFSFGSTYPATFFYDCPP